MRTLAKTEWRNALQELKIAGRPPRVNERVEHMRRLPRNSGVDEFRYGSAWDFRVWTPTKKLRAPLGPPVPTRIRLDQCTHDHYHVTSARHFGGERPLRVEFRCPHDGYEKSTQ